MTQEKIVRLDAGEMDHKEGEYPVVLSVLITTETKKQVLMTVEQLRNSRLCVGKMIDIPDDFQQ